MCLRLAMPDELEESALPINGKKNRLAREDFDALAMYLNVPLKVRYEKFWRKLARGRKMIADSRLCLSDQSVFLAIIRERLQRLELAA